MGESVSIMLTRFDNPISRKTHGLRYVGPPLKALKLHKEFLNARPKCGSSTKGARIPQGILFPWSSESWIFQVWGILLFQV